MNIMKYFTKEVKIGIVGIIALCLLVYGINYLKGIHLFRPTTYFYVKYENINGLTKSSPVYADGYKVGIVRNIDYDYTRPRNVIVEIELDTEMQIPKGSYADLETEMLGTVKMNLKLTSHDSGIHQTGDTIPGKISNGLMESVASIVPQLQSLIPKLDSILTSVNQITGNEDIPVIISQVRTSTAKLDGLIDGFTRVANKDIPQLITRIDRIGGNFEEISENLKTVDYAEMLGKIDATMTNVKLFTEKLNSKDNSLGLLLNDDQLYNSVNTTINNASTLLQGIENNPKRYVGFSLFGRKDK